MEQTIRARRARSGGGKENVLAAVERLGGNTCCAWRSIRARVLVSFDILLLLLLLLLCMLLLTYIICYILCFIVCFLLLLILVLVYYFVIFMYFFYCVRKSVIAREGVKGVESEQQQQPFGYA